MFDKERRRETNEPGYVYERVYNSRLYDTPDSFREGLLDWVHAEVIGPPRHSFLHEECIDGRRSPDQHYISGVLFPRETPAELDQTEEEFAIADEIAMDVVEDQEFDNLGTDNREKPPEDDDHVEPDEQVTGDDEIARTNEYRPSAMGISFVVPALAQGLNVKVYAATYRKDKLGRKNRDYFIRTPLVSKEIPLEIKQPKNLINTSKSNSIFENHSELKLRVTTRQLSQNDCVVTVSIINEAAFSQKNMWENCFFQCGFEVTLPSEGQQAFLPYRSVISEASDDPEQRELELLYRNQKNYALGHGCAASWDIETGPVYKISTESLPRVRIPPILPREDATDAYSMLELSGRGKTDAENVPKILEAVATDYRAWINEQREDLDDVPEQLRDVAVSNLLKCDEAASRIENGVNLLKQDETMREAFVLANESMLLQQIHYARAQKPRKVEDEWSEPPSINDRGGKMGKWRVFQLAFILMNLSSVDNRSDTKEREIVDLIWFPTGGGKTEAYLGLASYTIFLRRLISPLDNGCAVITRYTLRLLAIQQFQRTCSLICAIESIRGRDVERLGKDEITIGIWAGQKVSPNKHKEALSKLLVLQTDGASAENPFQLTACPWCGTSLQEKDRLGYRRLRKNKVMQVDLFCPEKRCDFNKKLPVLVVDEAIYANPPTILLGTVDKFALLAWLSDAIKIFKPNEPASPPNLIIQDELHLISGPVGTMVGLYEAAIFDLCSYKGRGPKIVGSTATIRRAKEQCWALYGREVMQFPPSGIVFSDNYFSKEDREDPGRLYVGVMPTASSSFITGQVRFVSALLEGADFLKIKNDDAAIRDGYWTLLQYFNSLRELGRAATLIQQDIPEWLRSRAQSRGVFYCRPTGNFRELNSRTRGQDIPAVLEQLGNTLGGALNGESGSPIDLVLATNMISVGVDVQRLGLMNIVGQPKTTSEYIQASSRVGRSKQAPGLVLTSYNPSKARDRSVFESFVSYHSALYKAVEPTSVTPFSIPALERGLHALLVICGRYNCRWESPEDFDQENQNFKEFVERLTDRCAAIAPEQLQKFKKLLEKNIRQWEGLLPGEWGKMHALEDAPLLAPPGTPDEENDVNAWPTLTSLRGVDQECTLQVLSPSNFED